MRRAGSVHRPWPRGLQKQVFAFVGLPPLCLSSLTGAPFSVREILKPRLAEARRALSGGAVALNEERVMRIFLRALEGKTGIELENAAAELLLTSGSAAAESDWDHFVAWVARRSQPLDPRLVGELGRFYAQRLNEVLAAAHLPPARAARGLERGRAA